MRGPQGLTPTQVRDDPTIRLTELEEEEEEDLSRNLCRQIQPQNCGSLSQPLPSGYGLGENADFRSGSPMLKITRLGLQDTHTK